MTAKSELKRVALLIFPLREQCISYSRKHDRCYHLCGIPEGWWVFVKAKYRTAHGGLRGIQGTHLKPWHLVIAGKKNGSDLPGYKNISVPYKYDSCCFNIGHSQLRNIIAEFENYDVGSISTRRGRKKNINRAFHTWTLKWFHNGQRHLLGQQ